MTTLSQTTRLDHSINTLMPETHGHQRKAFRDFVAALRVVRTCCQAALARHFPNFEAASCRLTRWLHNPRVEPQEQARAQAQAVVQQLPLEGTVRVAIDWTTEDQQHLLVASLVVGRRAVPLYWEAYTTAELKGAQRALERAFVDQVCGQILTGPIRERVRVTAERGFWAGAFLAQLETWGVGFVLRLTANVKVFMAQQWCTVGSLVLRGTTRRRLLGPLWCLRSQPRRYWVAQSRARNRKGRWEPWYWVSNRPLSAFTMAQEYARRFSCEEGFRDAKRVLGFAHARIAEVQAWARLFALVAAARLILTHLGTRLLHHPQRQVWLRQVRARRRARSELSLVSVVCHLLDQGVAVWNLLNPHTKLNLEATL